MKCFDHLNWRHLSQFENHKPTTLSTFQFSWKSFLYQQFSEVNVFTASAKSSLRFWAFWPKRGLYPRPPVGTHLKQSSSKMILCGLIKVVAPISKSTKSAYVCFKEQIKNLKKSAWALGHPPSFHYFWRWGVIRFSSLPETQIPGLPPSPLLIPLHGETEGGGQPSNNRTTAPIVRTWHFSPAQVSGKPVFSSAEYFMTWGNARRLDHLLPFLNFLFAVP